METEKRLYIGDEGECSEERRGREGDSSGFFLSAEIRETDFSRGN